MNRNGVLHRGRDVRRNFPHFLLAGECGFVEMLTVRALIRTRCSLQIQVNNRKEAGINAGYTQVGN